MEEIMPVVVDEKRYGRVLAKALPAVIQTEKENERALVQIKALMDKGDGRTSEEDSLRRPFGEAGRGFRGLKL